MRRFTATCLLLGAALAAAPALHADTTYTTVPDWDGSNYIQPFGAPNTTTYGEVITAPTDNVLTSYTFYLEGQTTGQVTFNPEVYAWNGTMATGSALYTGAAQTVTDTGSFTPVTINTGGVDLTTGDEYVLFFTITSADEASSTALFNFGYVNDVVTGSDDFWFLNNGGDTSELTSTAWDTFSGNLAYTANFTSAVAAPTPEPGSLALFGSGLAALAGIARRRLRG